MLAEFGTVNCTLRRLSRDTLNARFSHPMRHIFHEKSVTCSTLLEAHHHHHRIFLLRACLEFLLKSSWMQTNGAQRRKKAIFFIHKTNFVHSYIFFSAVYLANITASSSLFLFATFFFRRCARWWAALSTCFIRIKWTSERASERRQIHLIYGRVKTILIWIRAHRRFHPSRDGMIVSLNVESRRNYI